MDYRRTPEGELLNFLMENVTVFEKEADKVPQTMQQKEEPEVDFEQQGGHPGGEEEQKRIKKKVRHDAAREVKDAEVSNEGIVPDTSKDSEEEVIRKLDEADESSMLNAITSAFKSAVGMTDAEGDGGPVYDMAMAAMGPNTTWEIQEDGVLHGDSGELIPWNELSGSSPGMMYQLYGMALDSGISEDTGGAGAGIPSPESDYNDEEKMTDEEGYSDEPSADDEVEESLTCCESCGKVYEGKNVICESCKPVNEEDMDSENDYVEPESKPGPSYVAMAQSSTDATERATVGGRAEKVAISSDWKDTAGAFEQMRDRLPEMGLYVIDDPDMDGSDRLGVRISSTPWTAESIQASLQSQEDSEYSEEEELEDEEGLGEGIVPDTSKDSESEVIKKLDEADVAPKDSFLDAYKQLCLKHNMIIVSENECPLQVIDITAYPTGKVPMDQFVVAHIEKHVELLRGTAIETDEEVPGTEVDVDVDIPPVEEGCLGDDEGPVEEDDSEREKAFARIQKEHPEYSEEEIWKQVHKQRSQAPVEEELMNDEEDDTYDEIASLDDEREANAIAQRQHGSVIKDEKNKKFKVVKPKDKNQR